MLTRGQIQRLAQRHGIGVQAQERDYLQLLLLFLLYNRSQDLVFKGGTALRVVYGGSRYSEDLDFNAAEPIPSIRGLWRDVLDGIHAFGIDAEIRYEWQSESGYSFDVSYRGPLYDGRDRTKGKVRVDISTRQEEVDVQRELITSEYDDVRPFVATVISREHLLAEKVRALLMRSKPRDVLDIWLLTNQGIQLDKALVNKKLAPYRVALTSAKLNQALENAKAEWERDLRPLMPQLATWNDAMAGTASVFKELIP